MFELHVIDYIHKALTLLSVQQSEANSASKDRVETEVEVEAEEQVNSDEAEPEAESDTQPESEATSTEENPAAARRRQPENEVSEVDIPNVGKILVRSDADGYNEEVKDRNVIRWSDGFKSFFITNKQDDDEKSVCFSSLIE